MKSFEPNVTLQHFRLMGKFAMKKSLIFAVAFLLVLSMGLIAKDFWEEPFREWSRNEVLKMLQDSPWSNQVILTSQRAGRDSRNIAGEMEIYNAYTVRLFTALPVRQAYVRMMQIMNNYDSLSEAEQATFDKRFEPALNMDTSQQIIVNLDFETNDRQASMEVNRQLKQSSADQLRQRVYLISDRLGRVQIEQYFQPSQDGTGAKFVFPRQVDGQPVVSPEDDELKFEFFVPGTHDPAAGAEHKVFTVWDVEDLMFEGELEI